MEKSYLSLVGQYLLIVSTFSPVVSFLLRDYFDMSYIYTINILLLLSLFGLFFVRGRKYKLPTYGIVFLSFCIYTILSDLYLTPKEFGFKYVYSNEFIGTIFVFFIIENGIYKNHGKLYLKINEIILIIALIVIVIQQFVNSNFLVNQDYRSAYYAYESSFEARLPSIFSTFGGSIYVGFAFVPVFAIILAEKIKSDTKTQIVIFFLAMGAVFTFLTKYRWIMLNFIIACLMIFKYKNYYIKKGLFFVFTFVIVVLIGLFFIQKYNIPIAEIVNERILEKNRGGMVHGSASTRLYAIKIFEKLFPDNPILGRGMLHGFGPGASNDMKLLKEIGGRTSQIHVGYLSLFYYYGIVGGLIYITFLVSLSRKLYEDCKIHLNWGVFWGFMGFVIANFTLVTFHLLYPGIVILLIFNRYFLEMKDEEHSTKYT